VTCTTSSDLVDEGEEQRGTGAVRRDHRLEIRDVVVGPPRRIAPRAEHGADARFVETPRTDQREGFDQDAFLLEGGRIGRHRPRRLAAEIGVVAATRRIERRRRVVRLEDRRHHRHVRQMRAAREGIVRDEYVPRRHRREPLKLVEEPLHRRYAGPLRRLGALVPAEVEVPLLPAALHH